MKFLTELFAWWTGNTIGTRLFTWRYGTRVGEDGFGNVYFQTKDGKRRWVIYRDPIRSLAGPAGMAWLAALHRGRAADRGNLQGPALAAVLCAELDRHARRPTGRQAASSIPMPGRRRQRDYEPWQPGPSK